MKQTIDEPVMKPYLTKLLREHRAIDCLIDTTKALGAQEKVKALKRTRLRLKDKISALQRHYYGRALSF